MDDNDNPITFDGPEMQPIVEDFDVSTPIPRLTLAREAVAMATDKLIHEVMVDNDPRKLCETRGRLFSAVKEYGAACVAEALAKATTLGECKGVVDAINEECTCGGAGPGEGCLACNVYHRIKDMEIVDAKVGMRGPHGSSILRGEERK